MVNRIYVSCPICGKLYQIKIQLDLNTTIYEWPIVFECKNCGEILRYSFGDKGFRQNQIDYNPDPSDPPVTTIGYSSSLPITDELYMKDLDYAQSKVLFSPYMNLTRVFSFEEISLFQAFW